MTVFHEIDGKSMSHMAETHHGHASDKFGGHERPPWLVLRLVELTLDPGADVARALDLRQTLIEHEFGDTGCGRQFRLQDIGLTREQHAPCAEIRTDLVGTRLG